jgi:hypothetical protein
MLQGRHTERVPRRQCAGRRKAEGRGNLWQNLPSRHWIDRPTFFSKQCRRRSGRVLCVRRALGMAPFHKEACQVGVASRANAQVVQQMATALLPLHTLAAAWPKRSLWLREPDRWGRFEHGSRPVLYISSKFEAALFGFGAASQPSPAPMKKFC